MHEDPLVPIFFILFLAAIIVVPRILKSRERQEMQKTIRAAIERGQPLPSEMIDAMTRDAQTPHNSARDLRAGVFWLAIGAGLALCGAALNYYAEEAMYGVLAGAAIPTTVGVAFILLYVFSRRKAH